jgi:hypothetical protein
LPSDQEIRDAFVGKRAEFDELRRMITADEALVCVGRQHYVTVSRITNVETTPGPVLSRERWREYRRHFEELGLPGGVCRPAAAGMERRSLITFHAAAVGLVFAGREKGIAHLEASPSKFRYLRLVHIDGNWWVYEEVHRDN